jgi:peptide/nickel transport system permease protein
MSSTPLTTTAVGPATEEGDSALRAGRFARALVGFGKMPWLTKCCSLWLIIVVLAAVLADVIPGLPDPNYQGFIFGEAKTNDGPSASHWLGTDNVSRDILSRLIYGARVSLIFSISGVCIGVFVGCVLGSISGFLQGFADSALMSFVDVMLSFPALVGLLFVSTMLESRGLATLCLITAIFIWPRFTRVGRAAALSVAGQDFVTAAKAIGTSRRRILVREILPNVFPAVLAFGLVSMAILVILESTLSFLGLGVEIPTASWGGMIAQARQDLLINVWPLIWPSVTLVFTVYSFNNIVDWLRERVAVRSAAL